MINVATFLAAFLQIEATYYDLTRLARYYDLINTDMIGTNKQPNTTFPTSYVLFFSIIAKEKKMDQCSKESSSTLFSCKEMLV